MQAAELRADLQRLNLRLFNPGRGMMDSAACYEGADHGGYYGPFADLGSFYTHAFKPTPRQRAQNAAFKAEVAAMTPRVQALVVAAARRVIPKTFARNARWLHMDACHANHTQLPGLSPLEGAASEVRAIIQEATAAASPGVAGGHGHGAAADLVS